MWIDNRFHVYPAEHWETYQAITAADPEWEALLAKDKVNLLMLSRSSQSVLIKRVEESGDWCEQYRDKYAVIFSRCEPIL